MDEPIPSTPIPSTLADTRDARDHGTPEAWGRLCEKITARVRTRLRDRMLPDTHSPDDIAQDTLVEVVKRLVTFESRTREEFWSWVDRIADAQRVNTWRRSSARKRGFDRQVRLERPQDLADDATTQSVAARAAELEQRLVAALSQLSARHETVLRLRILHGMEYAEIAERMGYARAETVRVLFLRARRKLSLTY